MNHTIQIDRQAAIARIRAIVAECSLCPQIIEINRYRHRPTGKAYSPMGMPLGIRREDCDLERAGFAYLSREGTTFGQIAQTEQELIDRWAARNEREDRELTQAMEARTDDDLASALEYWEGAAARQKRFGR